MSKKGIDSANKYLYALLLVSLVDNCNEGMLVEHRLVDSRSRFVSPFAAGAGSDTLNRNKMRFCCCIYFQRKINNHIKRF